jgi:mannose-1-phosphate guanylyltransferase
LKAVVLAAGVGSRLGKVTENIPKPLLKINDETILERNIKKIQELGIKEVFINTHYFPDMIKNCLGNSNLNLNITYSYESELLGTAGALNNFKEYLNEDFIIIYGDNYFTYSLQELINFHKLKNSNYTIALHYRENVSESGVVIMDNENKIIQFIEKPDKQINVASHLVNAGIYIFSPEIFSFIPEGYSDFGKDIFPQIIKSGSSLYGIELKGFLLPVDTIELLNKSREMKYDISKSSI